jgi:chromosome segregation ATPase
MAGEKYSSSDNEVELDVGDAQEEEVEIEEESDVSESDTSDSEDDRSEHERHTDGAQTRINRLTKKMREAERQKDEAIRFAQQVQQEATQLKTRMKQLDTGYLTEYGGRLGMETAQAEAALKRAVEIGDSEAMVNAQRQLSQLYSAAEKYKQVKSQKENEAQYVQQPQQQQQQQPPQQQQQPPQQVRRPDVKRKRGRRRTYGLGKMKP